MDYKSNLNDKETRLLKVDESIVKLKAELETGERFNKLHDSDLFKEFILEGLLTEEANKLTTSLSIDPHTAESEELILVRLRSLKILRNYLHGKAESTTILKERLVREEQFRIELQNEEDVR